MKRLILALIILMLACGLFGWRANITFEPEPIKYIPIPVRDSLSQTGHHWYLQDWPPGIWRSP